MTLSLPSRTARLLFVFGAGTLFAALANTAHNEAHSAPPAAAAVASVPAASANPLLTATQAFLETLPTAQKQKARFAFDADERLNWHFIPKPRKGITYLDMDEAQRKAALRLLATCLSETGFKKAEAIQALELVLQEIENDRAGTNRNPDRYYFSVFGEPGTKGAWGLRYEGHHLSLNWTILDGRIIASTPQFLGANPGRVDREGPQKGKRVLSAEEDLGRSLARSLSKSGGAGIVEGPVPTEILTGAKRRYEAIKEEGIPYSELNTEQRGLLLAIVREHASVQAEAVAAQRLAAARAAGLDSLRFVWIGSVEPGQPHYYRIQGKTFLIEYDNSQNHANHVHSVWRDFTGDFGEDILTEHFRRFPAGTASGAEHGHELTANGK